VLAAEPADEVDKLWKDPLPHSLDVGKSASSRYGASFSPANAFCWEDIYPL